MLIACVSEFSICMHLRPRHAYLLMQTCKQLKDLVDGSKNKDYWTRVAAHLVWRNSVDRIEESRFLNLHFIDEGYAAAMDKVVSLIKKSVKSRATVGHDDWNQDEIEKENEEVEPVTNAYRIRSIKYWSPYMDATLEMQTRMKLLENLGTPYDTYKLSASDCLISDMKQIAKHQVTKMLESKSPNHDQVTAAELRKWVREFAEMPLGISNQAKAKLISDLRSCMMHRWDGKKMVKVHRTTLVDILGSLLSEDMLEDF